MQRQFRRYLVVLGAALLVIIVIVSASVRPPAAKTPPGQKKVTELPAVVSHVPRLQIVNIEVRDKGTPDATAVVEILNTSNVPVMSVEISTKNEAGDSGAVNEDGLDNDGTPTVVIPPHGTKKLEMAFGEMVPDAPLVLSAAVFADHSEEGDAWSRDAMRGVRAHRQELRRAWKEGSQKGGSQQ